MSALRRFQLRADEAADWTSINPTLRLGEPGVELDTHKVKYGDGVTAWNSLPYSCEQFTASITALAGLTPAADRMPYFTSSSAAALATLTSYARTLLDDADAATARTTLGLGTAATQASTAFVPSTGTKTISGATTASLSAPSTFALSVVNSDAATGRVLYVQGGVGASGRTFAVVNNAGTALFDIYGNGTIRAPQLPTYADNAAAVAGGLPVDHFYKTATGEVRIRV